MESVAIVKGVSIEPEAAAAPTPYPNPGVEGIVEVIILRTELEKKLLACGDPGLEAASIKLDSSVGPGPGRMNGSISRWKTLFGSSSEGLLSICLRR